MISSHHITQKLSTTSHASIKNNQLRFGVVFAQSEHDGARLLAQRHGSWCHFVGAKIVQSWGKSACVRAECAADWQQVHRTSTKTENGVAWDHPLGGVLAHPSPHNRPDPVTLPQNFSYLHNFSLDAIEVVAGYWVVPRLLLSAPLPWQDILSL